MPYIDYNLSLYRTGFRPYDLTNPFGAAHQTAPSSAAPLGYLGQPNAQWPMFESGGFRMRTGVHRVHSTLRGMGQGPGPSVCLDQNENTIACVDPNCTYGDCGSTGPQVSVGALCLDEHENQVDCASPLCTFGDCAAGGRKPTTAPGLPVLAPGPSPRTYAPYGLFPQTAPVVMPQPSYLGTTVSMLAPVLPFVALIAVVALLGKK